MRSGNRLTVVKLGGSYASSAHLKGWRNAMTACAGRIVVVPGGGPFADAVRAAQPKMEFNDRAAHHMALLAMEQYGCALASRHAKWTLAASATAIRRILAHGGVPVWCPTRMVLGAKDVPWSWDVTADSLAAWLAGWIGAKRLLLIKHVAAPEGSIRADDLVAHGIVDRLFPRFLEASGAEASMVGPADHAAAASAIRSGVMAGARIDLH